MKRYHTWAVHHTQTVGEHSARVAQIYCELWGTPRAEVLYAVLHHDSGELFAGDLPYPAKARNPALHEAYEVTEKEGLSRLGISLPALNEEEKRRVKIADLLEMYEFGRVEVLMGNAFGTPVMDSTLRSAMNLVQGEEEIYAVKHWVEGIYND